MSKKVVILVGSLRKESIARKIAKICQSFFSEDFDPEILEIRDLPLYNADYDNPDETDFPLPEVYKSFRQSIKDASGVLFVTPENNRTIPACLKNAVDVGSKPNGDVAWTNTPVAIISHSVGAMGGYSSQKNLRLALSYFTMPTIQQPEVFLGHSNQLVGDGQFTKESTTEFVSNYIKKFEALIEKNPKA
ncbi:NAD(P)H-dependent oxidoreductase [Atopobacter sp. AH10]|uniref:NADPH-dependent FMN reductase n=1 Tax=Atopobacter sp. AH10 TaxID=2315861 RepID=UPI000EF26C21|nr:NADPH-dependent FMN reductase [Atopobacter sp. AH10]RLK62951.1 NAD(P)H-dependent oxidoreductase [Atopobacter sp. AH10]